MDWYTSQLLEIVTPNWSVTSNVKQPYLLHILKKLKLVKMLSEKDYDYKLLLFYMHTHKITPVFPMSYWFEICVSNY